jgi:hypothetical protein
MITLATLAALLLVGDHASRQPAFPLCALHAAGPGSVGNVTGGVAICGRWLTHEISRCPSGSLEASLLIDW